MNDDTQNSSFLPAGTVVDHYHVIERIGAGGMGEVYLADDIKLDRRVALKFLPEKMAAEPELKTRFVREAKAAAKLHHPHIVTVFEVGEYKGRPYIAMEYVEDQLYSQFSKDKPLPLDIVTEYAIQLCQALGEAHRAGIVHRDIKTDNIAVDKSGRTRILDFGLAAVQGADQLTKTGSTLGTVAYMSPEQVSGRETDQRSDLFSLGVVLYELIAGRTPFRRDSEGATLRAIMEDIPEPLSRYRSGVPEALEIIILKLLEKDREIRYQSAEGVLADLKKLLYDSQQSVSRAGKDSQDGKKLLLPITMAATALIAIVAIVGYFLQLPAESTEHELPVLAVLPFENLGSAEDTYFSEGITDEIRSKLVGVEGMRVISGSSSDQYRNTEKSIQQIGRELGADYILEGRIRWDKSGEVDRIRINPVLTKTSNDYLMWAENYEKQLVEVFDIQSEIASEIVNSLGLTLLETGKAAPAYAPTENMEAYNYYLRGLELASKGIYKVNQQEVIQMYDSAIALDSNFATAWAKKSKALTDFKFAYITIDTIGIGEEALAAAHKALELDPNLPEAHIALGSYYNFIERDYDDALKEFALAKSEVAGNAALTEEVGVVRMRQGHWQEALEHFEEAARLDPLTVRHYYWLATAHSFLRDYDKSRQYLNRGIALSPSDYDGVDALVRLNLLQYGTVDSPDKTFEELVEPVGVISLSAYDVMPSASLGYWRFLGDRYNADTVISELRKVTPDYGSPYLVYLNIAQLFGLSNREDSAHLYYDSARIYLEKVLDLGGGDFHVYGTLALAYAGLGEADMAITAAQKSKEMMAVDDCHW